MLKNNFLHIAITIILITIYPWLDNLHFNAQLQVTLALIFLLGIPHGAIDHLLLYKSQKEKGFSNLNFYVFYLGLIAIYVVLWILMPYFSLFLFFLISFYHFGQSQFSFIKFKERNFFKISLYLVWGGSIISGLFYHHYDVLINFFNETSHFSATESIITHHRLLFFFIGTSVLSVLLMALCLWKWEDNVKRFWTEIAIFALLHLAFFTLPPLLAFSIYFAIWHSLKVLDEEYVYMKKIGSIKGLKGFIKLLLPYSSISIVGALLIIAGFSYFQFSISPFFLTIIFLSVLTLPHRVVMMNWYRLAKPGA